MALGLTLAEIEGLTVSEYRSWIAFYEEEPFGDVRADLRSGVVAAVIARTMGGRKSARPLDYMPIVAEQQKREQARMSQKERNAQMRHTFESNLGSMRLRRVTFKRGTHGIRLARQSQR